jgi:hypothetical protein
MMRSSGIYTSPEIRRSIALAIVQDRFAGATLGCGFETHLDADIFDRILLASEYECATEERVDMGQIVETTTVSDFVEVCTETFGHERRARSVV